MEAGKATKASGCCSWAFPIVLACLVLPAMPMPAEGAKPAQAAVPLSFLAAREAAGSGDWGKASAFLSEARSVDPSNSDILYLSALAALKTDDDARGALVSLEESLAALRFDLYRPRDAAVLRLSLLIRIGRAADALAGLSAPAPRGLSANGLDPEYRYLRTEAFLSLGKASEAISELTLAAQRFPDDPRFPRLFFLRFPGPPASSATRSLGELFARRVGRFEDLDPEIAVLAAPYTLDPARRLSAVQAFRARGLKSVIATLVALEYGIVSDEGAVSEFFALDSPRQISDLVRLASMLGTEPGRQALRVALRRFSGILLADGEGEGFARETATYLNGGLVSWKRDTDRDGRPEYVVVLREGLPQSALIRLPGLGLVVQYSSYPYVSAMDFGQELYRFGPESQAYAPLALTPFPTADDPVIYLAKGLEPNMPTMEAAASTALEVDRKDGASLEVTSLDKGLPLRRELFREGKVEAILLYENGLPSREALDLDGDGYFETERHYRTASDGNAAGTYSFRIDADRDGIFEYREDSVFPFLKEWDLDKDGIMDARQLSLSAGGWLREFASRLDGRFDETLEVDALGHIANITRDGLKVVLVQDANPRLRWIQAKPFDLGSHLPQMEGLHSFADRRYRLVYVGAEAFAELLP